MRFHKTTAENKKPSERRESRPAKGGKTGQMAKNGNPEVIRFDFHINHIKRDSHV
jgi:hypothetical protein